MTKLYYLAWPQSTWDAYQEAFRKLVSTVDGVERQAVPWPDWAITTIDRHPALLGDRVARGFLSRFADHGLRAAERPDAGATKRCGDGSRSIASFSRVNGGRARETDLFEGHD